MASRVNVKFVLILSAALTVVFAGVAGVALYVLSNSGPELEREGDQLMARGEFETAKKVYGKAYNHDRSSIPRLDKYIAAIEAWTPATPTEYSNAYGGDLLSAFHTHAGILRTNVESHERYLDARYQQARWFGQRGTWEGLADATDEAIAYFESDQSADDSWKRLLRYRGMALVALMDAGDDAADTGPSRRRDPDQAEKDLLAALEVNPDDTAAVIELVRYYNTQSQQLADSRRTADQAEEVATKAATLLDDFIKAHPTDTVALVHRMFLTYLQADAKRDDSLRGLDLIAARERIIATLAEPLDRLFVVVAQKPTSAIDPLHVDRIVTLEQLVTGTAVRSAELIDRILADRPDDPAMLDLRAMLARQLGDQEQALGLYKRIVEMPWPPVSLEGTILLFRQEGAALSMADVALALWGEAPDEEKPAALARVEELRASAGELVRDTDPRLVLLDGKIAFARQEFAAAQEKLSTYNELSGGTDVNVLGMLADIYLRSNELGSARETIQSLIALQPRMARHYFLLARVENALGNYDAARLLAQQTVELDPENAEAAEMLAQLDVVANPEGDAATTPVQTALIKSRLLAMGDGLTAPDIAGAIAVIDQAIDGLSETDADFATDRESLVVQKIEMLAISGDRATALEQTQQWMQTYPDNESLATLSVRLSAPDTLEGDFQVIDASSDTEPIKLVNKYFAALRRGENEMASQLIAQALALKPDEASIVELAFGDALSREDYEAAQGLADKAAAENLDRLRGESYAARLKAAQGDVAAAITTLRQATQSATAPAGVWRMLGQYQAQLGRYSEAISSFNEALNRSPNDTNAVLAYMETLVRAGRNDEALRVAHRYESTANRSSQFISLWLSLEAEFGDKSVALARREEIQNRVPDNRRNTTALIAMYIDLDRIDEARTLLDNLRGDEPDLTVVSLDAMLHAKGGDMPAARKVFDDYIASRTSTETGVSYADYASYASFLVDSALLDDAIVVLKQAREVQSPEAREADAALGRLLFNMNRFDEAVEALRSAVTTGDPGVRVLLADALIQVEDFAGAKEVIEASSESWEESLELSLVMIQSLNAGGDRPAALRLADETVRRFDGSPRPYVERARLKAQDPALLGDAMDDLTTAIRRDSTNWLALSLRAEINSRLGNQEDSLQDLRRAVRANPTLDFQRQMLIVNFFRSGRVRDAKAVADEAITVRPDDLDLLISMGDIFAGSGFWDQASGYFASAWDRAPSKTTGMRYIASLIRSQKPAYNDADRVLADPVCDTDNSPGMLVLRAAVRMGQEKPNIARRDARRAIELAVTDLGTTARILEDLNTVFETPQETAEFVLSLDLNALPGRAADHFRAVAMLQLAERENEGLDMLRQLATDKSDPIILSSARQLLISILLSPDRGAYAEALELMKVGLEEEPNDWSYANNIAYVLSTELDQPEEALVYAQRARKVDPNNAAVLDTLGYVYRRLKRYDDAERVLRLAVTNAPNPGMRISSLIHLGQTFVEQERKVDAQREVDEIESIFAAMGLDSTANTELQDLKQQIEGLK
jgi:tetratricopeptide (TPR) repeat protein